MIDVPVLVKEALRDGRRLKEYLFFEVLSEGAARTDSNGALIGMTGSYVFGVTRSGDGDPSAVVSYTQNQQTVTETVSPADGDPLNYVISIPTDSTNQSIIFKEGTTALSEIELNYIKVGTVIGNDNLVYESVKFDERMSSGDNLKFGLCEGSSLEFQYFEKPNLNSARIEAYVNVQYETASGTLAWYMIPMGFFTVEKCPQQVSTGIYKVTAYNKLRSEYLDADATSLIANVEPDSDDGKTSLYTILQTLLADYSIDEATEYRVIASSSSGLIGWTDSSYSFKLVGSTKTWYFRAMRTQYSIHSTTVPGTSYTFPINSAYLTIGDLSDFYEQFERTVVDGLMSAINRGIQDPAATFQKFKNSGDLGMAFNIEIRTWDTSTGYQKVTRYTHPDFVPSTAGETDIRSFTEIPKKLFNVSAVVVEMNNIYARPSDASDDSMVFNCENAWPWGPHPQGLDELVFGHMYATYVTDILPIENMRVIPASLPKVTLRELQSAVFEMACQFGKLDRTTDLFAGVELNNSRLLPADNLYPASSLYPGGWSEGSFKSQYSKLWTDSQGKLTFRYLIITYKGLDESNREKDFTLQRTVNANGNTDYYMSDNWLFKNLVWTAQEVGVYADEMVSLMQNVSWIPFEMWAAGLPYLETGDEIEITTSEGTFTSYILQRQLNGIQNLQDTYINGTLDVF